MSEFPSIPEKGNYVQFKCEFTFRDLTCEEFMESISRPDAPQWMREFAKVFCDPNPDFRPE